ncbi:Gp138 family membrane-puncturing spike protein [Rodentibacter caecimuris]|uniref:Gp138 family membrane-puncturing spike protein n=1 Tax=Rodentibacter caecimuris TaxID=1796644 RepID=UPI00211A3841|nr:Gp138 family membrane-puncturing spike protein [Rodentibacter heylii]MCQ9124369.1 phage baseplate protein [Rodentibacter heylii]
MTDISTALSEINVSLPGRIISYDPNSVRVVVQPTIPKRLANGEVLNAPQIVNVPVMFPMTDINGEVAQITLPVKSGDGCLLIFSQRSLENWLSGSNDAPDDPRMFDLSDAFCVMGGNSRSPSADGENLCIKYGSGEIKIAPSGNIMIKSPDVSVKTDNFTVTAPTSTFNGNMIVNGGISTAGGSGSVSVSGSLKASGDVKAGNISLQGHKHAGDSGGKTGVPE